MGFRFYKSIKIGNAFRINFSKSGVGYSFGGKGIRYTKTARGTTRTTLSIPGTGLSWSQEHGKGQSQPPAGHVPQQNSSGYLYSFQNADEVISADRESFVAAIKRFMRINRLLNWAILFLFCIYCISIIQFSQNHPNAQGVIVASVWLLFLSIIGKIVYRFTSKIQAIYDLDEEGQYRLSHIDAAVDCLKSCSAVWQVNDVFAAVRRTNACASRTVGRTKLSVKRRKPYFLRTNANCYYIKLKSEKLYVLPDTLLLVKKKKLSSIAMKDLDITVSDTRFVENTAPKDAEIIDYSWQYVNKDGTPDRRFNNNFKLPVCRYGVLDFQTPAGFHTRLHLSKIQSAMNFQYIVSQLIEHANTNSLF